MGYGVVVVWLPQYSSNTVFCVPLMKDSHTGLERYEIEIDDSLHF